MDLRWNLTQATVYLTILTCLKIPLKVLLPMNLQSLPILFNIWSLHKYVHRPPALVLSDFPDTAVCSPKAWVLINLYRCVSSPPSVSRHTCPGYSNSFVRIRNHRHLAIKDKFPRWSASRHFPALLHQTVKHCCQ